MVELKEEKDSEAVESTKDSTWVISGKGKDTKLGPEQGNSSDGQAQWVN